MEQGGLTENGFIVKDSYRSEHNGVTHVYLRQLYNGAEVVNADMNLNLDADCNLISVGSSFQPGASLAQPPVAKSSTNLWSYLRNQAGALSQQVNSLTEEPYSVLTNVPHAQDNKVPVRRHYILNGQNELEEVWDMEIEMEENWLHAHVSTTTGKVVSLIDWVADSQYNVYPLGVNDPLEGNRTLLTDPHDKKASPFGWHDQGNGKKFTDTRGNNVYAQENLDGMYEWMNKGRPDGGETLKFDFPLDLMSQPGDYLDAAVTNLFYINNMVHDLFYQYGFTEKAGNFQENNFERGGKGNDAVIANAQDGSGYNNANFATPPDGRHGKMRMYVWNGIDPNRDGDLESGIVIHEYAHGISTRLTGGPANSGCLGWGEAGGMGEGWGDFFATILRTRPAHNNTMVFFMGEYANAGEGIRRYPYSTSLDVNPSTYKIMDKPGYWGVHAKGEVWAVILYEVFWALVDKHGYTEDWFSASPHHGNTLALQLVVDGLALQPCRPSFMDARDAIIQADTVLTGGQNKCILWKAFAKRGLGVDANIRGDTPWGGGVRADSFKTPSDCGDDVPSPPSDDE
ncbi:Fungalysin metallopeptidase-domain-containing protein [Dimargaris cristalligena]|uniref:Extracellular metalloproteinase n=1 Tax=Dimargaris cristalligena TaxID=215637 RepID=A0A4P9ZKT9_9FUNG|nr:Fungalysin metallopeptidase-domain-containing protein [Dimargaris cristalligena]|eukprot:RKP33867.1 Fungalysin metallopeptidase-domain-containing protein [Dimargaris cristalligena]